jgi:hypothetical protein
MKRFFMVSTGVLLAMTMLSAGCAKATPAATPAATPPVTGALTGVNTPAQAGPDVVTVQTPQGPTSVQVTPQTGLSFNGQFCTIDQLDALMTSNSSYNCTIVYDDQMGALAVYVTGTGTGNVSGLKPNP